MTHFFKFIIFFTWVVQFLVKLLFILYFVDFTIF